MGNGWHLGAEGQLQVPSARRKEDGAQKSKTPWVISSRAAADPIPRLPASGRPRSPHCLHPQTDRETEAQKNEKWLAQTQREHCRDGLPTQRHGTLPRPLGGPGTFQLWLVNLYQKDGATARGREGWKGSLCWS